MTHDIIISIEADLDHQTVATQHTIRVDVKNFSVDQIEAELSALAEYFVEKVMKEDTK
jgi:hypothetical protein